MIPDGTYLTQLSYLARLTRITALILSARPLCIPEHQLINTRPPQVYTHLNAPTMADFEKINYYNYVNHKSCLPNSVVSTLKLV